MEGRTDQQLIDAVNAGDVAAFGELYGRYRDWVVRVAYRHCGSHSESLDVLQDAFTYFLRKFPGFELSCKLTTFLYPVVKNQALKARQKSHRAAGSLEGVDVADEAAGPVLPADPSRLEQAVVGLPAAHREVLLLRFTDDWPLADIAEALEIPLGTVKSRLHHALQTLRANPELRKYFE